ncbi:MAG: hypothetical protein AAGG48_10825 [Planctomycetota bacterium]
MNPYLPPQLETQDSEVSYANDQQDDPEFSLLLDGILPCTVVILVFFLMLIFS